MNSNFGRRQAWLAGLLAFGMLGLGFVSGYGYRAPSPSKPPVTSPPVEAPLVKGMRSDPKGSLVAFTAIYDNSEHSSVFLLDTVTGSSVRKESPAGWEDTVTQWSPDGQKVLFAREKIPRFAADASAGLYSAKAQVTHTGPQLDDLEQLTGDRTNTPGERIITGFWAPPGDLVIKTRREPKSLYAMKDGDLLPLDQAAVTYGQHRGRKINGKLELFVVRDIPQQPDALALFRIVAGKSQQLTPPLRDVIWTYVSEDCRQMIVARQNPGGEGWEWTLYAIGPAQAKIVKTATVPAEIIKVFWSPDGKTILGTGEAGLWAVQLPSLKAVKLGQQSNWQVDDACWLGKKAEAVIAANGELWRLEIPSGKTTKLWRFPPEFWDPQSSTSQ